MTSKPTPRELADERYCKAKEAAEGLSGDVPAKTAEAVAKELREAFRDCLDFARLARNTTDQEAA